MLVKLLIGLLIIACLAPLFLKGPDGEPVMTLDDWKPDVSDSFDGLLDKLAPGQAGPAESAAPDRVYKWQDETGVWHFSSERPENNAAEELVLTGDINLMDAFEAPVRQESAPAGTVKQLTSPGVMSASPEQVRQIMETVTNLEGSLEKRKSELDAATASGG
ncbi:MAG: DUF4124 domain-containing protein [Proteobacteria bacterium]|nr:DUF4124 domain-containing protein [Pseudomonadota bacterium]